MHEILKTTEKEKRNNDADKTLQTNKIVKINQLGNPNQENSNTLKSISDIPGSRKEPKTPSVEWKTYPNILKHHDSVGASCTEVEICIEKD